MKRIQLICLLVSFAGASFAQQDDVTSAEEMLGVLLGQGNRGIVAVATPASPLGMSIDLTVNFELGSSEVTEQAIRQLDILTMVLNDPRLLPYRYEIVGHTDARGDAEYNMRLSLARAAEVRRYLVSKGVNRDRLVIDGRGEDFLLYPHRPEDPGNRRVEITNAGETSVTE